MTGRSNESGGASAGNGVSYSNGNGPVPGTDPGGAPRETCAWWFKA